MALALGEDGDENIRPGRHFTAGRLGVDDRPLDHPLEACGRLHVGTAVRAYD